MADFKYWAFISYSSTDVGIATRLFRAIETYRVPRSLVGRAGRDEPVPRRIFPVFRDRDELPLSSDLGTSIQDALRASRYLIVVCSPEAARSRWVNEEVRHFKAFGREDYILAVIVAGEPNASDAVTGGEAECFPPALRCRVDGDGNLTAQRTEPIAGDLRRGGDGWRAVLLKAVAGITGLGYDAFAKREAKRVVRRRIVASAAAGLLLVAGLFYWDYARVKVGYYAQMTQHWGVPEGVIPLNETMRAGRNVSYRVESRGYKVREVLCVNSAGALVDDPEDRNASRTRVVYREDGSLLRLDLFNRRGSLVLHESYSPPQTPDSQGRRAGTIKFEGEGGFAQTSAARSGSVSAGGLADRTPRGGSGRSSIVAWEVLYGADGCLEEVVYRNAYGSSVRNVEGVFGQLRQCDDRGLVTRVESLGSDRRPLADQGGMAVALFARDERGQVRETAYLGVDGKLTLNRNGCAKITMRYDKFGNVIETAYSGLDGRPTLFRATGDIALGLHDNRGNIAKITDRYDDRGNRVEEAYFGVDGKPALNLNQIAKQSLRYNSRGDVVEEVYYGVDGKPTIHCQGHARTTYAYDEHGWRNAVATFGMDGKPVRRWNAFASLASRFDERGRSVEEAYFLEDGRPVYRTAFAHDERGNGIEQAFFGADGKPLARENDCARRTSRYDERGNCIEVTYFGVDGRPTRNSSLGYARATIRYDECGSVIEEAYFGVDGNPTLSKDGDAKGTWVYDERGNCIECASFGVEGKPTLDCDGCARWTGRYDERGNQIEESCFGVDGNPTLGRESYAKLTKRYDGRGDLIEEAYFGLDGNPTLCSRGYAKKTMILDERGNVVKIDRFGLDGTLVQPTQDGE